ncbi:hypothetical protein Pelo_3301 [Pelomyxa schiedti]|nr:hypothetical protein Pelo_3301 [Pelomyxa schiedti]
MLFHSVVTAPIHANRAAWKYQCPPPQQTAFCGPPTKRKNAGHGDPRKQGTSQSQCMSWILGMLSHSELLLLHLKMTAQRQSKRVCIFQWQSLPHPGCSC